HRPQGPGWCLRACSIPTRDQSQPIRVRAMRSYPLTEDAQITSPFDPRSGGFHTGCDFGFAGGAGGEPVYACAGGTVQFAGEAQGYGGPDPAGWLVVDHPTEDGGG